MIGFWMYSRIIQRVFSSGYPEEAGALFKCFVTQSLDLK